MQCYIDTNHPAITCIYFTLVVAQANILELEILCIESKLHRSTVYIYVSCAVIRIVELTLN